MWSIKYLLSCCFVRRIRFFFVGVRALTCVSISAFPNSSKCSTRYGIFSIEHLDFDTVGSDAFGLLLNETITNVLDTRFKAFDSVYRTVPICQYDALNIWINTASKSHLLLLFIKLCEIDLLNDSRDPTDSDRVWRPT